MKDQLEIYQQQKQLINILTDTAYQRASKVVHELHRQMKSHQDAEQYLIEICDVLYGEDDVILRHIAVEMKKVFISSHYCLCWYMQV